MQTLTTYAYTQRESDVYQSVAHPDMFSSFKIPSFTAQVCASSQRRADSAGAAGGQTDRQKKGNTLWRLRMKDMFGGAKIQPTTRLETCGVWYLHAPVNSSHNTPHLPLTNNRAII